MFSADCEHFEKGVLWEPNDGSGNLVRIKKVQDHLEPEWITYTSESDGKVWEKDVFSFQVRYSPKAMMDSRRKEEEPKAHPTTGKPNSVPVVGSIWKSVDGRSEVCTVINFSVGLMDSTVIYRIEPNGPVMSTTPAVFQSKYGPR